LVAAVAAGGATLAQPPGRPAAPRPVPEPLARVQAGVERLTRSLDATWGVYVKCLETGEEIGLDADRQMDTMSVIKIPLMVEAFAQAKEGRIDLAGRYTLTAEDQLPGTGVLRYMDPGAVLTVKDLLTLMIVVSDNTATDVVFRMVGGPEAVNRRMDSLGLAKTRATGPARRWFDALRASPSADVFHREARTPYGLSTPREIGTLLESMERGELVDRPASELMLRILRGQLYRTRIPRFVSGYPIPHKTGDFLPFIGNDVGVLEMPGRRVVVSVFTANHYGEGAALEEAIGRLTQIVAEYFAARRGDAL
jgi:beta-lactamase class A